MTTKVIDKTHTASDAESDQQSKGLLDLVFSPLRSIRERWNAHPLSQEDLTRAQEIVHQLAQRFKIPEPTVRLCDGAGVAAFWSVENTIELRREITPETLRRFVHHEMIHAAQAKLNAAFILATEQNPESSAQDRRLANSYRQLHPDILQAAKEQGLHLNRNAVECGRHFVHSWSEIVRLDKIVDQTLDPDDSDRYMRYYRNSFIELGPSIEECLVAQEELLTRVEEARERSYSLLQFACYSPIVALGADYACRQFQALERELNETGSRLESLLADLESRYLTGKLHPAID